MGTTVDSYGWKTKEGPHSCGYIAPEILKILADLRPRRVLDLGCGNGALAAALAQAGYEVVGVDADAEGIAIASTVTKSARFYRLDLSQPPSEVMPGESKFDVVVSTEVIEHLYSPHELPRFAARILAEKGMLVISTPYHGYLKNLALSVFGKWDRHFTALWHGGHIKFWSVRTLSTLLESEGFKVIGVHGAGRVPLLWKSMILVAQREGRAEQATQLPPRE